jgi:hypothetical protein
MEDSNLLRKWNRVVAPPDFENRVLAGLSERRKALPRMRRARIYRLSLAGAAAALLAVFSATNVFLGPKAGPSGFASGREALPITEVLNYGGEIRSASSESRPVYILEYVSNASNKIAKY